MDGTRASPSRSPSDTLAKHRRRAGCRPERRGPERERASPKDAQRFGHGPGLLVLRLAHARASRSVGTKVGPLLWPNLLAQLARRHPATVPGANDLTLRPLGKFLHPEPQTPSDGPRLTHRCLQFPRSTNCWARCWPAGVSRPGVGRGGGQQHCSGGTQEEGKQEAARPPPPRGRPPAHRDDVVFVQADHVSHIQVLPLSPQEAAGAGAGVAVRGVPPRPSLGHPSRESGTSSL